MISFGGLTLTTNRHTERLDSAYIRPLHTRRPAAKYVPEGQNQGLYHTPTRHFGFFHAWTLREQTKDQDTLRRQILLS